MIRFVEEHDVKPALDDVAFGIEEVREAYRRLGRRQHVSTIVVQLRS